MKTKTGSFGVDTQASNSLVTNLLKYPEIGSTLIEQYPRYALTYLLEKTGRHASVKVMGDKSFEWKVLGRQSQAVTVSADYTGSAAADAGNVATRTLPLVNNFLALNDVVVDSLGFVGQVTGVAGTVVANRPTATATTDGGTGYTYTIKMQDGCAAMAAASVFGKIGSAFGEGSLGSSVSEYVAYPDTHKNWLTLNRSKLSINGSALTDVTWIENNGSSLWYFTAEKLFTDEFMYQLELQRWFGRASVTDAATADGFPGEAGTVAAGNLMGDGILAQIEDTVTMSYDPSNAGGLTEDKLARFIAELSRNAKSPEGNEWVVFTGTEGRYQFHRAMKDISVGASTSSAAGAASGGTMQSMKTGSDVALGVNFVSYYVLGNKMTVAYCPVFDDANVHGDSATYYDGSAQSANATPGTMSGKMVFLDFSSVDGVPNIQLVAKGADGLDRNYIKKYIPGMVNPYDQKSMLAANGDDSFTCQIMSESAVIVRNPLSCGILEAVHV
tara:strand:- start:529 stop:2025 length:1497 start_codon:yes stop_codon:yes gene_type:complete